jgi:thymidine phosphorylase
MDRPLGRAIGNALEVAEAVAVLQGGGPADLRAVTVALAAEMLVLGEAARDGDEGRAQAEAALDDGRGLDRFRAVVEAQGGDVAAIDDPSRLPTAPVQRPVAADRAGRVAAMATRAIGEAAVELGAGRATLDAEIDPRVGFVMEVGPDDVVEEGQPLATVHAADEAAADRAAEALRRAITLADATLDGGSEDPTAGDTGAASAFRPLISHRVTRDGIEKL